MRILILAAVACLLAACSSDSSTQSVAASTASTSTSGGSWFWPFGGDDGDQTATDTPQLGVNSYLWRATLDTLNFMPLASADPVGGVVISDWYAAPDKPDEHMKVTVYILDKRLRADAVKVSVFRQVRNPNGWTDASVNADTGIKLENAILARARELRLATTPQ
jgi:ABC-type oligopeptide transport system substrate-binding subunit